ncbi:MAG: hypothetical protein ACTSW1_13250 [Candidatus Hodarchaeales archaeon]
MTSTSKTQEKLPIRVDLDREDAEKFTAIQSDFKLKNKAEVLRFCVNKVYHGMTLEIDDDIREEIEKLISSRQIKIKYAITSVDDFIKRAISDFLETLKKERSLKNWSSRQELSELENDTAVTILDLQMKKTPGVTIDDLLEVLDQDEQIIRDHLNKFIAEGLVDFRESRGKMYYYAP